MEEKYDDKIINISLKDLIEVSTDAAKRTRWVIIALVLICGIISIGFYNSTKHSFANERLKALSGFENLPINKLHDTEEKPMLDSLFGKYDFKDTNFKENKFTGLKAFLCNEIYNNRKSVVLIHHTNEREENKQEKKYETVADLKDDMRKNPKNIATVNKYLYENFNTKTQSLIKQECEYPKVNDFVFENEVNFEYLTNDLNKILSDKFLYQKHRFFDYETKLNENEEIRRLLALSGIHINSTPISVPANPNSALPANNSNSASNQNTFDLAPNPNEKKINPRETNLSKEESDTIDTIINTKEIDIVRFNRLLLETAFPDAIYKSKDIIPSKEAIMIDKLAAKIAFDDKVLFLEVPFFGIAIDVNSLGAVGGISLIVILSLLRFSLSREIKNLNLSFRQAFYQGKLCEFYHWLAMRLVIVVPDMEGETKNQALSAGAKHICLLPLLVIIWGVGYDYYSIYIYGFGEPDWHLVIETFCVFAIAYLSFRCVERFTHLDEIWEDYFLIIRKTPDELLNKQSNNSFSEELSSVIHRRLNNNSEKGRFPNSKFSFVRWLGKTWIMELLTLKNLSRLMSFKWLAESVADGKTFLRIIFLSLFIGSLCVNSTSRVYLLKAFELLKISFESIYSFGKYVVEKLFIQIDQISLAFAVITLIAILIQIYRIYLQKSNKNKNETVENDNNTSPPINGDKSKSDVRTNSNSENEEEIEARTKENKEEPLEIGKKKFVKKSTPKKSRLSSKKNDADKPESGEENPKD